MTVYEIDDGRRGPSIHVGDGPVAMAFSSNGLLIFVVDNRSADVALVRTADVAGERTAMKSLFTILPTGRGPNAIAVKAFRVQ